MKKTKFFFIIIFAFINSFFSCQQFKNQNFTTKEVDKVVISTVYFKDKTTEPQILKKDSVTMLYYPSGVEPNESIVKTGSANLNKGEIKKLTSLLQTPISGHALPYQYDIQLDFYNKNKIVQTATISSETKNLIVKKIGCKTKIDENEQEIVPCFFIGMVSDSLKKYVVSLLKNKKLWNKEQQFMEDYK
ncbi:hypothetical protein AB670_02363 [Chryseobacterium sp. MOF25P]|uniref:hypothetical protein n=1 Tax=unclassified Chryseobacterium TaxID=2593645 RepID=UPI000805BD35|nr:MULTISPECIES: hypothetical protein [unclassified Chryseobacterium]OBW41246.1 hypothetical protein AB670_02363 [Chryseobacterium sp. MOF25P]OBW44459.1 hypothetical protein AB671_03434 [Chryseobacterium sp. BGARF1]